METGKLNSFPNGILQSLAFLLSFCLALLLCNNSRIVHCITCIPWQNRSCKTFKVRHTGSSLYLNQNWFSHKAWSKSCCTAYTAKPQELWWPQPSLQPSFLLCLVRDNSTHLWTKAVQNMRFAACWSCDILLCKHQCLWISVKNKPTTACNMHTGTEYKIQS